MNLIDIVLIAMVLAVVAIAIGFLIKQNKKGKCACCSHAKKCNTLGVSYKRASDK